jgi:hypothetical protein
MHIQTYLANLEGHSLLLNTLTVSKVALEKLANCNLDPLIYSLNSMRAALLGACLFHEVGKIHSVYQNHIHEELPPLFPDVPQYHEISFAYAAKYFRFHNTYVNRAVLYAIYWHQNANINPLEVDKNTDFLQELRFNSVDLIEKNVLLHDSDYISKVTKFVNTLLNQARHEDILTFDLESYLFGFSNIQEIPTFNQNGLLVEQVGFKLIRQLLKDSIDEVASWSKENLMTFNIYKVKPFSSYEILQHGQVRLMPKAPQTKHDIEQQKFSEKLKKIENNVVIPLDPAEDRLKIGLFAHAFAQEMDYNKLLYVVPTVVEIEAIYKRLDKEVSNLFYNYDKISFDFVYDGRRQHSLNLSLFAPITKADVTVMTIDRLLLSSYSNKEIEYNSSLNYNIIFDNFHSIASIEKILFPLKELLHLRNIISPKSKTWLFSSTPSPCLVQYLFSKVKYINLNRDELTPLITTKTKYVYDDVCITENEDIKPDSLICSNTIEVCQSLYLRNLTKYKLIVHSNFTKKEIQKNINNIIDLHGNMPSCFVTYTSKMINPNFNANFKNGYISIENPTTNCQQMLNINKFGNKSDGVVHLCKSLFGNGEYLTATQKGWTDFLQEKLKKTKSYTPRQMLVELFDVYYENVKYFEISIRALKRNAQEEYKNGILNWFPKTYSSVQKPKKKIRAKKKKFYTEGFRELNYLLSASIIDENGKSIGQLEGEDLLNISNKYLVDILRSITWKLKAAIKSDDNFSIHNKDYLGKSPQCPLFCSYRNDIRWEQLQNDKMLVYRHDVGLVTLELLKGI